nr:T9SS type A sorting domain-containing protein [Flavobacterium fryxellicola]
MYDVLGQIILAVPTAQNSSTIDVSELTTGPYFLKMKTDKGFSNSKFLKK